MSDQILSKILEDSFTIHELRQKVRVLKTFIGSQLYGQNLQTDSELEGLTAWLETLGADFFRQFNLANFSTLFAELEKKIETLAVLIIYFAIEPNPQQLSAVGRWLRESYGAQFLYDPKYDPSLIGGCALVWKGIYKDYSLRAKIAQNQDQILQVIRSTVNH